MRARQTRRMRGINEDERDNIQTERVNAAGVRLRKAIKHVQSLGVQQSIVKRAQWLLSRFMRFSDKDRRVKRAKKM